MTLDEAIKHCLEVAEQEEGFINYPHSDIVLGDLDIESRKHYVAEQRQLAEWLTELKKARSIIRVCKRVLWFLLVHEIKSTSTRREVETLLKNITEYLTGGSENAE